jgi:Asp-tRNA(Asn)/Glu-tRNA(Gln) amidotransferase A subunit family amidase
MEKEPYKLSATEAIEKIKAGNLTSLELISSYVNHIKKTEPKIHAWAFFDENIVLKRAKEIDHKIKEGTFKGKLFGIPFGVKDIYNTIDMPTEMGSPIWKDFTPGNDSRCVFYLKYEGGIVMGKTVTAEFAVHHPGPTVNPHNPEHTPGTSSSGSAAAVATSMVPIAIGSQTAGSTIRPASYCGVYGYKPTFGLIPRTGVLKTVDVLDHVTIFSRTIEDLKLAFDNMRVMGHNFPLIQEKLEDQSKQKKSPPWKIAFIKTHLWETWEDYAKEAFINFINKLSKLEGIEIKEINLPEELKLAHETHDLIYNKALSYYYNPEYTRNRDQLSTVFKEMLEKGIKTSSETYKEYLSKQQSLIQRLDEFFEENNIDCILTLSTAGEAQKGLHSIEKKDSCLIWTLCGVPTVNLPVFKGPNGLPFGAQAIFRKYKDYSLFNFLDFLKVKEFIQDVDYQSKNE